MQLIDQQVRLPLTESGFDLFLCRRPHRQRHLDCIFAASGNFDESSAAIIPGPRLDEFVIL
jgi:hypothetical protein